MPDQGSTWPRNTGVAMPPAVWGPRPAPPAKGTLWPSALGWLMIVVAAGGVLGQAAGGVTWGYLMLQRGAWEFSALRVSGWDRWAVALWGPAGLVLHTLAFLGGWLLLARRRAARVLLVLWSIGSVLKCLAWSMWPFLMLYSTPTQPSDPGLWRQLAERLPAICVAYAPAMVLPIGVLVWLLRPTIRRQMKAWRDPQVRRNERFAPWPSRWAGALGAILVVFGITPILRSVLGLVAWAIDGQEGLVVTKTLANLAWYGFLPAVLGVLGMVAGCTLYGRRPAGAILALALAVAGILKALVGPLVNLVLLADVDRHMGRLEFLLWQIPYTLAGAAWPAFLLIWLLRPAIREQVRSWRAAR